jgi:hypothetical protein
MRPGRQERPSPASAQHQARPGQAGQGGQTRVRPGRGSPDEEAPGHLLKGDERGVAHPVHQPLQVARGRGREGGDSSRSWRHRLLAALSDSVEWRRSGTKRVLLGDAAATVRRRADQRTRQRLRQARAALCGERAAPAWVSSCRCLDSIAFRLSRVGNTMPTRKAASLRIKR